MINKMIKPYKDNSEDIDNLDRKRLPYRLVSITISTSIRQGLVSKLLVKFDFLLEILIQNF